jgi:hypothetical protein
MGLISSIIYLRRAKSQSLPRTCSKTNQLQMRRPNSETSQHKSNILHQTEKLI